MYTVVKLTKSINVFQKNFCINISVTVYIILKIIYAFNLVLIQY
jgi:hypothetical protein